jgi:hypothetical protein
MDEGVDGKSSSRFQVELGLTGDGGCCKGQCREKKYSKYFKNTITANP